MRIAIDQNQTSDEIHKAEWALTEAVRQCSKIDEWHRFKNPESGGSIGQLREKVAVAREVMVRLRNENF